MCSKGPQARAMQHPITFSLLVFYRQTINEGSVSTHKWLKIGVEINLVHECIFLEIHARELL